VVVSTGVIVYINPMSLGHSFREDGAIGVASSSIAWVVCLPEFPSESRCSVHHGVKRSALSNEGIDQGLHFLNAAFGDFTAAGVGRLPGVGCGARLSMPLDDRVHRLDGG
jgi:hypothetical protein